MQTGARRIGVAAIAGVVLAVGTGCGAGPSSRPDVAVVEHGGGSTPRTSEAPPAPDLRAPVHDLAWTDCTTAALAPLGVGPGPDGLVLECATFTSPVDTPAAGPARSIQVGATRARLPRTPLDAAPLVLTSGADAASSTTLAALATGPSATLLERQPIVAVDRRGFGASTPIDCGDTVDRRALADLGQFTAGGGSAADAVAAAGRDATVACTDAAAPYALAFDTAHAADDLEQLRRMWQVDTIALLGTGNGAAVALAFTAKYPERVGRLVLDAPAGTTVDAATAAEHRAAGQEAALAAYARRCAALACALGADPVAAVTALRDRAAAGELGTVSSSALLASVSGFLGSPRGDQTARVRELADVLAAADRGDVAPLQGLIAATDAVTGSDGQFVARCSDGQQWPGPGRVEQLRQEWATTYPVFGADAALGLLRCAAWPATPPPALPTAVPVPILVFDGAADPVVGTGGLSTLTGSLTLAGAPWSGVRWEGFGHPATTHSECARGHLTRYLEDATLPPNAGACPA
ncbi:alpha/beta hydrolase [Prescottella subtropica]|uniref:alpha/beta hydrolase n=1 Tax=Prescottella subtropica TaxID=2545757 RepID=UPI001F4FE321|nr:alpha/beta fold hydrolase [Prescottella subtropica]